MANDIIKKRDERVPFHSLTLVNYSDENKVRSLNWGTLNGNPRMTVFLDNTKKPDGTTDYDKMITAPFLPLDLLVTIDYLKEVLKKGVNDYEEFHCLYPKYVNNQKTDDVVVKAKIRFGIDKEGIVYFYVENINGIKIKFTITQGGWHLFKNGKDAIEDKSKSELSQKYAKKYLDILERLIYKTIERKTFNNFNNNETDETKIVRVEKYNNNNSYKQNNEEKVVEEKIEASVPKVEVKEDFADLF